MNENDFVIGKFYHYSELPDEDTEEISVIEYGKDYIGMNAIHIRFFETETDV